MTVFSTRMGLPIAELVDACDVPASIAALIGVLDPETVVFSKGTTAGRPGASGIEGKLYYATDTGILYFSIAGVWQRVDLDIVTRVTTLETAVINPGDVKMTASSTVPGNWLLCDGASYLRTTWPNLYAAIGVVWGAADGTHFNVPDLRGRAPIGAGSGAGLTPRSIGPLAGGEERHTLSYAESGTPSHVHPSGGNTSGGTAHHHTAGLASAGVAIDAPAGTQWGLTATGNTGDETAHTHVVPAVPGNTAVPATSHNIMQPSAVVNYIIRAV